MMHQQHDQALPFVSCYQPSANQQPLTAPAVAPTTAPAGVCIMRAQGQDAVVDASTLQQAGLKTRYSASCIPDLIITSPALPAPLAIMVVTSTSDPARSLDSPAFMQRCVSMVDTFRVCAVALPHILGSHPTILQLACDARFKGKILLQHMCPGDNPANTVLQLVSCCSNSPEAAQLSADAWDTVVAAATAPDALGACMSALMSATA